MQNITSYNYQQLSGDGLVSWKLKFLSSYAIGHNCPIRATYAGSVLQNNTNFRKPLLSWFNTHHTLALTLFNFLAGDPQRYSTQLSSRRVTVNQGIAPTSFVADQQSKTILSKPIRIPSDDRDSPLLLV
ncbi:hypothetical protein P9112_005203 [Eukaryota sp. TZLM1-RC]